MSRARSPSERRQRAGGQIKVARSAKKAAAPSSTGPTGRSERVGVKSANEQWSTINLEDGSILEIRPAIVEVRRLRNKFNDDRSPIYSVKAALLTNVNSPKKLYKKAAKNGAKKRSAKKK